MKKLIKYIKESYAELRRVTWPTRQEALRSTGIVVAFAGGFAIFLGVVDFLFNLGLNYLISIA
ncbi:MAG: preprotein translocase subunit SecE [Patescibacteria group bacterium]|jgi:preprotein translocase subunit SecE